MSLPSIHVLLVEDNPGDARLVREFLEETSPGAFCLTYADCLSKAREALSAGECDVIVLDLSLPDCKGIETYRSMVKGVHKPVVVLTGIEDGAVEQQLIAEGAFDYLPKRHLEGNLLARILRNACSCGK